MPSDGQNKTLASVEKTKCFFCLKDKYGCQGIVFPGLASHPFSKDYASTAFAACRDCLDNMPNSKKLDVVAEYVISATVLAKNKKNR